MPLTSIRRTRPTALALLLFALSAGSAMAQGTCRGGDMLAEMAAKEPAVHAEIMAQAAATENTQALLWKVEKPGVEPSYLFGTVHLTDDRVTKLSPAVKGALDKTKTVALEVEDLSDAASTAAMGRAATLVVFADGQRLDKLLSAKEYEKVKAVLAKAGMPGDMSFIFRPWIVYLIMSVSDCERQKVQAGVPVLDMRLAAEAKARKVPVVGLETIEQQLETMAALPEDEQLQLLRATLHYADRADDMMETLLQLYLKRQIGAAWPLQIAMAKKAGIAPDALSGFMRELVVKRNQGMAANALPLIAKGNAFVGVGALHLPGKDGLVNLVREAGYTVTAVE